MLLLRGPRDRAARARKLAEQRELQRRTGYAGGHAERGHRVAWALRARGYSPAIASYGGHLAAVAGRYNFQGQVRLAQIMGYSLRSMQRYRLQLERDGLIQSCLLEPGDMLDGMRSPVTRYHVVRDLGVGLLALSEDSPRPLQPRRRRRRQQPVERTAAAAQPPPPGGEELSPEDWQALIDLVPVDMVSLRATYTARRDAAMELATRRRPITEEPAPVPPGCVIVDDAEIDRWDRDTESLERWIEHQRRQRPPPQRE